VLREIRALTAELKVGLLTHDTDFSRVWSVARELRAGSIHPYWALAGPEIVRRAGEEGLDVIVWTVNDIEVMTALAAQGVDGIISDYPERFRQVSRPSPG
jgi:glycerophosphoryl diester phosphodiesterase